MGAKRVTINTIKERLLRVHGNTVSIKEETFINTHSNAIFIDFEFGEWEAQVKSVLKGSRNPKRWAKCRTFDLKTVKRKIFEKHGTTVKIKEETYTKTRNKATFIDSEFGEWECTAILVLRGHGHHKRADLKHRISLEEIRSKILKIHGDEITIISCSYEMVAKKALFIDKNFGQFECAVNSILHGTSHPLRKVIKSEKTCFERYGVKNASQVPEKSLKSARKLNERFIRNHWKTGKELVCQASWEAKVVDYLNINRIDFIWQHKAFFMPDGQTYRPDFFWVDRNIWIEIKGLIRPKFQTKWDWFKTQFPDAELWDKKKLKEMNIL